MKPLEELDNLRRRVAELETREAEYRQAVEALRDSEEKYRILVDESSDPIFAFYPDGRYRYVNKAFAQGVGRKQEEIIGRAIWDIFPKEEADKRFAAVKWVFENGLTRSIEVRVPRPDGDRFYLTTVKPILDLDSTAISVLCISKEITDRKLAEDRLRQSEERYRTILEDIEDGYYEVDLKGNFVFFNESFLRLSGYTRDEIQGLDFRHFTDSENAQRTYEVFHQVYVTGIPVKTFEWAFDRKDGLTRHFDLSVSLTKDSSGNPSGFRGLVRDITQRKEAEEALKTSEKRYRDIFEQAVEGIFQSTPEGKYIRINPALARMTGYASPEEMLNSINDIGEQVYVNPGDRERFKEILEEKELLEGFETEHFRKDGSRVWVSITARAIRDKTGKVVYYEGTKEDINARKLTEKKHGQLSRLREELIGPKRFDEKMNIITDGLITFFSAEVAQIWLVKSGDRCSECRFSQVNKGISVCRSHRHCLHLMAGSGSFLDDPGLDRMPLGDHKISEIASGKVPKIVTNEVSSESEKVFVQPEGQRNLVSFAGFRLLSAEGIPIGVMALFGRQTISTDDEALLEGLANSTAQVIQTAEIEKSLRESEERYRTAIEQSNDGFALVRGGVHLYVNQKMVEIFGYDRQDEIIGKPIGLVTHPDDLERVMALHRGRMDGKSVPSKYEFKGRRKNGEPVYIEISVSRTMYKGDQAILAYLRDITDRKKAEEERVHLEARMREVQKLESLGVMAGGIAHDFNNLLMAILGNADLALYSLSPASPARPNIEEIVRASQRAADLCQQMLAYSGKGRFVVGPYNLAEIIREMTQILEVSISKKAILKYSFAKEFPAVKVDATQIRQVIMNLITNASEALGDQSGTISLSCGVMNCDRNYLSDSYLDDKLPEGNYVYLEVSDTGEGMDAEIRERIFEPFYSTKFIGRGLGLAAVLGIVRGHQGAIKVYSQPGIGSTFRILLPALDWVPGDEGRKQKSEESVQKEATLLLIDDDPHVRKVGKEMLARLGFKVLTAADGRAGVDLFQQHQEEINVVILDLTMPEMGGEEALKELRALKADVPVILSSGYNEQDITQRFDIQGLAGFIQKPYTIASLRDALNRVLQG